MGNRKSRKKHKNKQGGHSYFDKGGTLVRVDEEQIQRPPGWVSPYKYTDNKPSKHKGTRVFNYNANKVKVVFEIAEDIFGSRYWCVGDNDQG